MMKCAAIVFVAILAICAKGGTGQTTYTGLSCEGGTLPLACPAGTYINVVSALFGRDDNNITCPHPTAQTSLTTCSASTALQVVSGFCQGRPSCDVSAYGYYFSDPCAGTYKFLRVKYTCNSCVNAYGDDASCEQRALNGDCVNAATAAFMSANCSKACYKCENSIPQVATNAYTDVNCTAWAAAGECTKNPPFMTAYCKKACDLSERTTVCANKASDANCTGWYNSGECTGNNSDWMLANCAKACFACASDTIKCQNQNSMCDVWALSGECVRNPGYMVALCTKSCLGCSADPVCVNVAGSTDCASWAAAGECRKNSNWMYRNCWKACTLCSGAPTACSNVNDDSQCEAFAQYGECKNNPVWMYPNCRQSCTRCKPWTYGVPNCVDAYFNSTQCAIWASNGSCSQNPTFMLSQCYKSCTGCIGSTYYLAKIGNMAAPGAVLSNTAGYTVILPYTFSGNSRIYQFSAFFVTTNTVHLQVWRPNGTNTYLLVVDVQYTPTAAGQVLQILASSCLPAQAGDQLGFTSLNGPAPIGYNLSPGAVYNQIALRQAPSTGSFYVTSVPFDYSLSAEASSGTC